jgi:hypothetical protein
LNNIEAAKQVRLLLGNTPATTSRRSADMAWRKLATARVPSRSALALVKEAQQALSGITLEILTCAPTHCVASQEYLLLQRSVKL